MSSRLRKKLADEGRNEKEEAAMLTYSEGIVGLWLVPVVLCILVPLAMFCVWTFMQLFKKTGSTIEQIEESAKAVRSKTVDEGLHSQSTV